jgi:hypothetical protein
MRIRTIDPKYHVDLDLGEIVKTSNGVAIPRNEPLILFRARDRHARKMLRGYRRDCKADGCTPYHLDGINNRLAAFNDFAEKHPGRMKQPGCTMGK